MFDFDGTLIDTMEAHGKVAADVIRKHFGVPVEKAMTDYYSTTGVPFPRQLDILFPDESREKKERCAAEYDRRKADEVYREARLFPDIKEALLSLDAYPLIISTSTESSLVRKALLDHDIMKYFAWIFCREQEEKPEHIKNVKASYDPDRIVFTGDSKKDVELNRYDRVVTIGRYGTGRAMRTECDLLGAGANYAINDLRQVPSILDEINKNL
jgi:phosphoglycolate phosphatase-like HAD superfamily hydrolase